MPHITFIHGIANKPPKDELQRIWLGALADEVLGNNDGISPGTYGITTSMIYWADVLYASPAKAGALESVDSLESADKVIQQEPEPDLDWLQTIPEEERKLMEQLAKTLRIDDEETETVKDAQTTGMQKKLEAIPLPWPLKKWLMKVLLKDVHHYFFNYPFEPRPGETFMVQEEIRKRVLHEMNSVQTDNNVVIAHSMGTAIMYDCLLRANDCPAIDTLITVGSPLGLDEVQHCLKPKWSRQNGYPAKVKKHWVNVYDTLDPVTGLDGNIANDYKRNGQEVIEIINEQNEGAWRHDIVKYLRRPMLRAALARALQL
jgi:hypothetical protein